MCPASLAIAFLRLRALVFYLSSSSCRFDVDDCIFSLSACRRYVWKDTPVPNNRIMLIDLNPVRLHLHDDREQR